MGTSAAAAGGLIRDPDRRRALVDSTLAAVAAKMDMLRSGPSLSCEQACTLLWHLHGAWVASAQPALAAAAGCRRWCLHPGCRVCACARWCSITCHPGNSITTQHGSLNRGSAGVLSIRAPVLGAARNASRCVVCCRRRAGVECTLTVIGLDSDVRMLATSGVAAAQQSPSRYVLLLRPSLACQGTSGSQQSCKTLTSSLCSWCTRILGWRHSAVLIMQLEPAPRLLLWLASA